MKVGQHAFGLGEPSDVLTLTPDLKSAAAELTSDDWMLLAQVGKVSTLGDVLSRSSLEEAHTVALLDRLISLGVLSIAPAGPGGSPERRPMVDAAPGASREASGGEGLPRRRLPTRDILELDGCAATREVSEAQRTRAQSSVAAALEAASVSPVPEVDLRRARHGLAFGAAGAAPSAAAAASPVPPARPLTQEAGTLPFGMEPGLGASAETLHFGPSPVPSISPLRPAPGLASHGLEGAASGQTLHFGPSPVPAIGALTPEGATLPFGASQLPSDAVLSGRTLHFGPSPVPAIGALSPEGATLPFGASQAPLETLSAGGTLQFGRSPVPAQSTWEEDAWPADGLDSGAAATGATLHFGPSPLSAVSKSGARGAGSFSGAWDLEVDETGEPDFSPIPIVARLAAHEVNPPTGARARPPSAVEGASLPPGVASAREEGATASSGASAEQLSATELEEAFADTLVSAPRPPELEQLLNARGATEPEAAPAGRSREAQAPTPPAASALLLETEVFDGIGKDAPAGAPPPLSGPDEAGEGEVGSAEAAVVLAGLGADRAELVAELTEAATHDTATEPPDSEERCAGHAEGLPFTPAPSVHNPGRARTREAERPAREAKLPPNVYEEVLRLERLASKGDLFAVFSLPRGASPAEVKKAFHSLSRRLHPDHYFHLGGGAQKARLETVFRRIAEAHATLVDPERRRAWAEANPSMSRSRVQVERPVPRAPDAHQRDAERRERLARHPYLLKQAQPRIHLTQGKALLARGEFGEALELLERARTADPENPEIPRLLASAREGQKVRRAAEEEAQGRRAEAEGRLEEAVACYRRAATLDPTNGAVALQAARMIEREGGDLREARLFAQRAVELRPSDVDAQWLLAQILLRSGARKLARAPLEEVLRLQPKHPSARSQLRQLRLGL